MDYSQQWQHMAMMSGFIGELLSMMIMTSYQSHHILLHRLRHWQCMGMMNVFTKRLLSLFNALCPRNLCFPQHLTHRTHHPHLLILHHIHLKVLHRNTGTIVIPQVSVDQANLRIAHSHHQYTPPLDAMKTEPVLRLRMDLNLAMQTPQYLLEITITRIQTVTPTQT